MMGRPLPFSTFFCLPPEDTVYAAGRYRARREAAESFASWKMATYQSGRSISGPLRKKANAPGIIPGALA